MDLGLNGRVAMVMAAAGGLGSAIASALAREGAHVAACDVDAGALEAVARRANEEGLSIVPFPFDLREIAAGIAAIDAIDSQLAPPDIIVNITGGPPATPVAAIGRDDWHAYFDSMVVPVIKLTDRVLPHMRESGWGRIITSTSSGVIAPIPNLGLSNSLRTALVGWSKTLAGEVGADGVTVNIVVPGRIATRRVRQLDEARANREGRSIEDVEAASTATIPVGRYGRPEEYADAVTFLSSTRASFITGSTLRVDGGMIPSI